MKRYLDDRVRADLNQKLVIVTGPRQVGKTTLKLADAQQAAGDGRNSQDARLEAMA